MREFDNQLIDINGLGQLNFAKAMYFFFTNKTTVVASATSKLKGLILFWYVPENVVRTHWNKDTPVPVVDDPDSVISKLPYPMDVNAATQFAWFWLQSSAAAPCLEPEPDHDGDNKVGWRVYSEVGESQALLAVQPIWAMYGK
jgi:hypothetical protein